MIPDSQRYPSISAEQAPETSRIRSRLLVSKTRKEDFRHRDRESICRRRRSVHRNPSDADPAADAAPTQCGGRCVRPSDLPDSSARHNEKYRGANGSRKGDINEHSLAGLRTMRSNVTRSSQVEIKIIRMAEIGHNADNPLVSKAFNAHRHSCASGSFGLSPQNAWWLSRQSIPHRWERRFRTKGAPLPTDGTTALF